MSVVRWSQESLLAWGDGRAEEAFRRGLWPSVSVGQRGCDMKTKLWNVRGHLQELSSLRVIHFTWGLMVRLPLTDGWITAWIIEQLWSATFRSCVFFSSLPNCHIDFDAPKMDPLFFGVTKQEKGGKQDTKWFWLGPALYVNIKVFWK